jgi:IS30 family transposase
MQLPCKQSDIAALLGRDKSCISRELRRNRGQRGYRAKQANALAQGDYNPIEQVFAKLKTLLRKAQARTVETLWSVMGSLLGQFSSGECENYIRHCGYCKSG